MPFYTFYPILNEVKKKYQAEARKIHVNCNGTLKNGECQSKKNGYGIAQFVGFVADTRIGVSNKSTSIHMYVLIRVLYWAKMHQLL